MKCHARLSSREEEPFRGSTSLMSLACSLAPWRKEMSKDVLVQEFLALKG